MSEIVSEFERLLEEMEQALVSNDVERVRDLTVRQQLCLSDMVSRSSNESSLRQAIAQRMPAIQSQLERNQTLLNQAMSLTDSIVRGFYQSRQTQGQTRYQTAYKRFMQ